MLASVCQRNMPHLLQDQELPGTSPPPLQPTDAVQNEICAFCLAILRFALSRTLGLPKPKEHHMCPALASRALCIRLAACAAGLVLAAVPALAEQTFVRGKTQYIAALGATSASSGNDAETWGFWAVDPGPRGVWISDYQDLLENAGVAPDGWQFDSAAWWLEEHGLMMETPVFPLPAGSYVVTGGRDVTSVLTVAAPDATGKQAWSIGGGASLYDVTHLGCRAAVYTASAGGQSCSPDKTDTDVFPMRPDISMPDVEGCTKQDYQVLIVTGMMVES